jgi:hypothetical protein
MEDGATIPTFRSATIPTFRSAAIFCPLERLISYPLGYRISCPLARLYASRDRTFAGRRELAVESSATASG